jgi:SAM-dependent methyltransferase
VIDVGGGDARLVDALLSRGVTCVSVLDVSATALSRARARLGHCADTVQWIEADVTDPGWQIAPVDFWHDRAVFHFLVGEPDRGRYLERLRSALRVGGSVILGTFAPGGPQKCSGLPVQRYSPEALSAVLGAGFTLLESLTDVHQTPFGTTQLFQWCGFRRTA